MGRRQLRDGVRSDSRVRHRGVLLAATAAIGALMLFGSSASAATAGWLGEAKLSNPTTGDGWEPAIAAGASFSAPLQVTAETGQYYYSNGGAVLPNGTAVMVGSEYPEGGNSTRLTGPVPIVVFRTTNGGTSWTRTVVDTLNTGASYATS